MAIAGSFLFVLHLGLFFCLKHNQHQAANKTITNAGNFIVS